MITVDASKFERALEEWVVTSSRKAADVLNDAARDVIIRAAALTMKANPDRIQHSLTNGTVTIAKLKYKPSALNAPSGNVTRKPKTYFKPTLLVYLILNARQRKLGLPGLNNDAMSKAAQSLIKRRKAACGFTAYAGWQKALIAFGGRGFGSHRPLKGFDTSSAAHGSGKVATASDLVARMVNTARMAERIGTIALQEALNQKAQSIWQHMSDKIAEAASEHR